MINRNTLSRFLNIPFFSIFYLILLKYLKSILDIVCGLIRSINNQIIGSETIDLEEKFLEILQNWRLFGATFFHANVNHTLLSVLTIYT